MSTISSTKNKDQFRAAGNQPQEVIDKVKEAAETAADKAKEVAGNVAEQVSHVASVVGQKADQVASGAGTGIKNLGESIKAKGPQEGTIGDATRAVGTGLEQGGKYIEEAGLTGMVDDLGELIKRNPIPAVVVGLGLGIIVGRAFRS
jgi:hypothetical protein